VFCGVAGVAGRRCRVGILGDPDRAGGGDLCDSGRRHAVPDVAGRGWFSASAAAGMDWSVFVSGSGHAGCAWLPFLVDRPETTGAALCGFPGSVSCRACLFVRRASGAAAAAGAGRLGAGSVPAFPQDAGGNPIKSKKGVISLTNRRFSAELFQFLLDKSDAIEYTMVMGLFRAFGRKTSSRFCGSSVRPVIEKKAVRVSSGEFGCGGPCFCFFPGIRSTGGRNRDIECESGIRTGTAGPGRSLKGQSDL